MSDDVLVLVGDLVQRVPKRTAVHCRPLSREAPRSRSFLDLMEQLRQAAHLS